MNSENRLQYVDIAKGIGMICIILGHLGESNINRIVFTFHVPIFFLITGYFINSNSSISNFVKNKVKTLIVPYIITSLAIITIATLQGYLIGNAKEAFFEWLYAAIYGAGGDYTEPFYIKGIGALWFLWATFWGSIFLKISLKFQKWSRMSFVVVLFILGYELKKWFWFPLSIQAGACATLFMYVGYLLKKSKDELKKISSETKAFGVIFALGVWISFIKQFQSFWLVSCDVGRGIIDIFGSICACACVFLLSWIINQKVRLIAKPLVFVGRYSLFVLCIHITELNLLPWWQLMEKMQEYGISHNGQLICIIFGKFLLDLGGAWVLSEIKRLFGMKHFNESRNKKDISDLCKLLILMIILMLFVLAIIFILAMGFKLLVMAQISFKDNDWLGFLGNCIGTIVGAVIAIYVLLETLKDNKKTQIRNEIISFCNCLTEISTAFSRKYEETIYEAHYVLENTSQDLTIHNHFIATHHDTKALLNEIISYLTIRSKKDEFRTPIFEETLDVANRAYELFVDYESIVYEKKGEAVGISDTNLIEAVEKFINLLYQYEEELLNTITYNNK